MLKSKFFPESLVSVGSDPRSSQIPLERKGVKIWMTTKIFPRGKMRDLMISLKFLMIGKVRIWLITRS